MIPLIIVLAVVAVVIIWFIATYNRFVHLRIRAEEAWADIEVQLKRRYDLIPNLVNTVKGYASHESSAFENVTKARAAAMGASSIAEHATAEANLGKAVTGLFGIAEAYPELKANVNFLELQRELSDTENKIQASRRFYNTNVRDLNIGVQTFPASIVANMFKVMKKEFFDLPDNDAAQQVPNVTF